VEELSNIENVIVTNSETKLFGSDGLLDSMGLVNLVVNIEERIQEEYKISILLADERAMSRSQSPFRTLSTLAKYIEELLREEGLNV